MFNYSSNKFENINVFIQFLYKPTSWRTVPAGGFIQPIQRAAVSKVTRKTSTILVSSFKNSIETCWVGVIADGAIAIGEGRKFGVKNILMRTPKKLMRYFIYAATRKTTSGKIACGCLTIGMASYEVLRYQLSIPSQIDFVIKGASCAIEGFIINDSNISNEVKLICDTGGVSGIIGKLCNILENID